MDEEEMADMIRSMASSLQRLASAMEVLIDQIEELSSDQATQTGD